MSRQMIVLAVMLAALVGGASSYAARLLPLPQQPNQPAPRARVDHPRPPLHRWFMGKDAQITSSGKFVYVLSTDTIFQFDGTTMEFIKKVKLNPIDQFYKKDDKRIDGQAPRKDEP